ADRNRSHWSTSKTPSYTKSVSWQHHRILTKNIAELSGGEKQRISLIRNLQFMPKVLLLDEITSALDESNKHNVNEMIHRYVREQNIAVLWVTHDKDEINHADKVITLQPHAGEMQEARYELA
ncbi:ATP-binding cassette domain-containing protein, partial [Escherichia coli]|nr:ATP-binding cassette domain-containing protein [Escherichia coli]